MPRRLAPEVDRLRTLLRATDPSMQREVLERELEAIGVAALAADDSSRYVAANGLACELTGYSADELLGMTVMDLTPPESGSDAQQLWNEFVDQGAQRGEYELVTRLGAHVRVRYWAYSRIAPGIHLSLLERVDRS